MLVSFQKKSLFLLPFLFLFRCGDFFFCVRTSVLSSRAYICYRKHSMAQVTLHKAAKQLLLRGTIVNRTKYC